MHNWFRKLDGCVWANKSSIQNLSRREKSHLVSSRDYHTVRFGHTKKKFCFRAAFSSPKTFLLKSPWLWKPLALSVDVFASSKNFLFYFFRLFAVIAAAVTHTVSQLLTGLAHLTTKISHSFFARIEMKNSVCVSEAIQLLLMQVHLLLRWKKAAPLFTPKRVRRSCV